MIDGNAKLGEVVSESVRGIYASKESENGSALHEFLAEQQLFLPATFADFQIGESTTWTSPAGFRSRIDYVALPLSWRQHTLQAKVLDDVDLAIGRADHDAVACDVKFESSSDHSVFQRRKPFFDRAALSDPVAVHNFVTDLQDSPAVAWAVDVHRHYHTVNNWIRQKLAIHFPVKARRKKQEYINDDTWGMINCRKDARKQLRLAHKCKDNARRQMQGALIHIWHLATFSAAPDGANALLQLSHSVAFDAVCHSTGKFANSIWSERFYVRWIRQLNVQIPEAVVADKSNFVDLLAQGIDDAMETNDAKKLSHSLRYFSAPTKKRPDPKAPRQLPLRLMKDGTTATTTAQAQESWRQHCADLEHGFAANTEDATFNCMMRQNDYVHAGQVDASDLVTYREWFAKMCHGKFGRALREGGVPDEVFKIDPAFFAKFTYPLALKMSLRVQERIQAKGGILAGLYKGSGPLAHNASYRPVLVSDALGKKFRSVYREKMISHFDSYCLDSQCGGRHGRGKDFAAHAVRLFIDWTHSLKINSAVLFVDLVSTFHVVLRGLV